MRSRSVESPHYHIWTDALHARELARRASNDWDRGSYVRWGVGSAWTAFEAACQDALSATNLGIRFRQKLDAAFTRKSAAIPDWGKGLWQDVSTIYALRKQYVHPGIPQARLFAPVSELDMAIAVLRLAIKDVYKRAGKPIPDWPDDDEDVADQKDMAHGTVVGAGAVGPDVIRVTYVMRGKEYPHEVRPEGTDPQPIMDRLLKGIRVPVSHIRAYKGDELIDEWTVRMRGS